MGGRFELMPDAKPFKHIMGVLVKSHGSIRKAIRDVGIGVETYLRLVEGEEVTVSAAQKIMASYKKLTGGENAKAA